MNGESQMPTKPVWRRPWFKTHLWKQFFAVTGAAITTVCTMHINKCGTTEQSTNSIPSDKTDPGESTDKDTKKINKTLVDLKNKPFE
jgi:hypothetical protein